mgnify:CR=1 FL=1
MSRRRPPLQALGAVLVGGAAFLALRPPGTPADVEFERASDARRRAAPASIAGADADRRRGVEDRAPPGPADGCVLAGTVPADPSHEGSIVLGLSELVREADRIVVGRIVASAASWNEDRSAIFTRHTIRVTRVLEGPPTERVELRVVGGEIVEEDVSLRVSHQPRLEQGDEGVFFLSGDRRSWSGLAGGEQGVLRFESVRPDVSGVVDGFGRPLEGVSAQGRLVLAVRGATRIRPEDLVEAVREWTDR